MVMMTISTSRASPSQARGEGEEEVAQPPRARVVQQLLVEMVVRGSPPG